MDETYIKVKGEWVYLYRAVDKLGKTLDFMLSKRRSKTAATKFFARALEVNGLPRKIVIDKSGANTAGISAVMDRVQSTSCRVWCRDIDPRACILAGMVGEGASMPSQQSEVTA